MSQKWKNKIHNYREKLSLGQNKIEIRIGFIPQS